MDTKPSAGASSSNSSGSARCCWRASGGPCSSASTWCRSTGTAGASSPTSSPMRSALGELLQMLERLLQRGTGRAELGEGIAIDAADAREVPLAQRVQHFAQRLRFGGREVGAADLPLEQRLRRAEMLGGNGVGAERRNRARRRLHLLRDVHVDRAGELLQLRAELPHHEEELFLVREVADEARRLRHLQLLGLLQHDEGARAVLERDAFRMDLQRRQRPLDEAWPAGMLTASTVTFSSMRIEPFVDSISE